MSARYDRACEPAGPLFDALPADGAAEDAAGYARWAPVPPGWTSRVSEQWRHLLPAAVVPEQGWKIHVSATHQSAVAALQAVHEYCAREAVAFKHLCSPAESQR
ncbi:hypothetical protein Alo02nite_58710 [Actinoplanes lobatus]|uniref:RamC N-terminal domain-containing protein n=1 Tax=Actinoplanes lobatus TaxID=113568 RepID=A0ABQ4APN7_9ACTN|nr:hypothetical protein Alo02nite_58710 [Actinoplanes lobatus]